MVTKISDIKNNFLKKTTENLLKAHDSLNFRGLEALSSGKCIIYFEGELPLEIVKLIMFAYVRDYKDTPKINEDYIIDDDLLGVNTGVFTAIITPEGWDYRDYTLPENDAMYARLGRLAVLCMSRHYYAEQAKLKDEIITNGSNVEKDYAMQILEKF